MKLDFEGKGNVPLAVLKPVKETPFEKETLEKEIYVHFEKETYCKKGTPFEKETLFENISNQALC